MSSPVAVALRKEKGGTITNVRFENETGKGKWVFDDAAGIEQTATSSDALKTYFKSTERTILAKQKKTAAEGKLLSRLMVASPPDTGLKSRQQRKRGNFDRGISQTDQRSNAQPEKSVRTNLFPKNTAEQNTRLTRSSTNGTKNAAAPVVQRAASTPPPPAPAPASAPASAPPKMQTLTVAKPPGQPESKAGEDDDDVSSQDGVPLPDVDAAEPNQKAPPAPAAGGGAAGGTDRSIENGVGKQALQQQNQPTPLAMENAAPTGFQGAAPALPARKASGTSNVIHKVAVQRISAAKGIPFETYRQAYLAANGAEVESMSDNELYQSSVDLCDQGIDTVKIKKPRFTSGRANLVREFIELNVLYNMAKPKEAEQGSKLAMLLDASNMGISAEHMMQALKGSVGGGDGHIKQNAALHLGTGQPSGPPAGSAAALDYADKQKQQEKNKADAGLTMGDSPNALNVKNTASYTSTTMHGKRIEREFIMDRLRFDNNFSQDTPVTETTFHFKKKAPESRKLIRF